MFEFTDSGNLEPLLEKYGKRKHPLEYTNRYQLLVSVILSARDSDKHINDIGKQFFNAYPSMEHLSKAAVEDLFPFLSSVTNFGTKASWLINIAQIIKSDEAIPRTMEQLTKLPGIGRKSANVIIRESGDNAEGVIVDLHVVRVAPRIGIAKGTNPEKIEKQLITFFPQNRWNEAGMAISFLGREICRPTNPKCSQCPINRFCQFYLTQSQI
jgi:endonuclease-3